MGLPQPQSPPSSKQQQDAYTLAEGNMQTNQRHFHFPNAHRAQRVCICLCLRAILSHSLGRFDAIRLRCDIGFFALPLPYTVSFGTRAITPIQYEHSESEENKTQFTIACIKRPKCFYQRRQQQQQHQPKSTTNRSIIIECRRARSLSRIRFGVRLVQNRSPSQ